MLGCKYCGKHWAEFLQWRIHNPAGGGGGGANPWGED